MSEPARAVQSTLTTAPMPLNVLCEMTASPGRMFNLRVSV